MDWYVLWDYRWPLLNGLTLTIWLSAVSIVGSTIIGVVVGCLGTLPSFFLRRATGAYVETMRDLYRSEIRDFNDTYGSIFDSFDALASAQRWRLHTDLSNSNETRENVEFLKRIVRQYYQTAFEAACPVISVKLVRRRHQNCSAIHWLTFSFAARISSTFS